MGNVKESLDGILVNDHWGDKIVFLLIVHSK